METLKQAADLVLAALENDDDDEVDALIERVREANQEEIQAVDWTSVTPEAILARPEVKEFLLARIERIVDHLTYMNDPE